MLQVGSANGYRDLLQQLVEIATAQHFPGIASIAGGGAGYAVGDILEVDGGTSTHEARIRVTSETAGVIDGAVVESGGAYSVAPANAVSTTAVTGGGAGATFNMDALVSTGWTAQRNLVQIGATALDQVVAGGTGYSVNDIITVLGGTGTAATLRVTAETGGVIDPGGVSIETPGEYTVAPSNPVSVTGPGNDDATFDLFTHGRVGQDEVVLEGGVSNFVGMRTYEVSGPDVHNWELAGLTGYDATLAFTNQANISPGRYDNQTLIGGAYLTLTEASAMPFWVFISDRRIYVTASAGANYPQAHLGFVQPYATALELPYPMYVSGNTSNPNRRFSDSTDDYSSPIDPIAHTTSVNVGPGLFRLSTGSWGSVVNSTVGTGSSRVPGHDFVVYPSGEPVSDGAPIGSVVDPEDQIIADTNTVIDWSDVIPNAQFPGSQVARLRPTPDTGGDLAFPVPCTLIVSSNSLGKSILGSMEGVYWVAAEQGIVSEDTLDEGTDRFRIFQNGAQANIWTFGAIKEE